jgi:hypothetical protein
MQVARLPRFQRSSEIRSLRLTDRDLNVLRQLGKHKFLRSNHFASLLPGSRQQIIRRLQSLYHHGYLQRPRCQIDYFQSGSRPIVYGLGHKGVALLKSEFPTAQRELGRRRVGQVQRLFLEHAIMVSDFLVSVEVACRRRSDVRLIATEGIKGPKHFQWNVDLAPGVSCGVVPDAVFGLEVTNVAGNKNSLFFFLEADRGTMPVTRTGLGQSSFYRKLLAYAATWDQGIHQGKFDWKRFRVLTLTTNAERRNNLVRASKQLKRGRGLFLFSDSASLCAQADILTAQWHTAQPSVTSSLLS